jgi:hypothetical protein
MPAYAVRPTASKSCTSRRFVERGAFNRASWRSARVSDGVWGSSSHRGGVLRRCFLSFQRYSSPSSKNSRLCNSLKRLKRLALEPQA